MVATANDEAMAGAGETEQVIDLKASRTALITGSVGHLIEWYEFAVYGYLSPYIAKQFFPNSSASAGLVSTFLVFALAFVMRPLGAVIFGRLTDKLGRRPILVTIILMMTLATTIIGILPSTASIGMTATVFLVLCRIVQGISGGGEMGGAVSLTVENAPEGKRGLYASWSFVGTNMGVCFGGAVATILSAIYSPAEMQSWAWRIPFIAALPLGVVALYIRTKVDETPHFKRVLKARAKDPSLNALAPTTIRYTTGYLLATGGVLSVYCAIGNVFMVAMPSYLALAFKMPSSQAYFLSLVTGVTGGATMPLFGWLSDRYGRRSMLMIGAAGTLFLSYPMYMMMASGFAGGLVALFIAGILIGATGGPMPSFLSERFPTRHRGSGVAIVYGVVVAVFGGSAPTIITWLLRVTKDPLAAAYYTTAVGLISVVSLLAVRAEEAKRGKTHLRPLED